MRGYVKHNVTNSEIHSCMKIKLYSMRDLCEMVAKTDLNKHGCILVLLLYFSSHFFKTI